MSGFAIGAMLTLLVLILGAGWFVFVKRGKRVK